MLCVLSKTPVEGKVNLFDFCDDEALQYALQQVGGAWRLGADCPAKAEDAALGIAGSLAQSYEVEAATALALLPLECSAAEPLAPPPCTGLAALYGALLESTADRLPPEDRALAYAYQWHLAVNLESSATLDDALQIDTYLPILLLFCVQQLPKDQVDPKLLPPLLKQVSENLKRKKQPA